MKLHRPPIVIAFILILYLSGGVTHVPTIPSACAAAQKARALIVVGQSEGETERRFCISFQGDGLEEDPEAISGIVALQSTGLAIVTRTSDSGGEQIVCKIGEVGSETCNPKAGSWSYFHGTPSGSWEASPTGPGSYRVHDTDVEGWVWTPRLLKAAPPSATADFQGACPTRTSASTPSRSADGDKNSAAGRSTEATREKNLLPWLALAVLVGIALVAISAVKKP